MGLISAELKEAHFNVIPRSSSEILRLCQITLHVTGALRRGDVSEAGSLSLFTYLMMVKTTINKYI